MTKNRTPTPVYLDPGMHPGLEVKELSVGLRHLVTVSEALRLSILLKIIFFTTRISDCNFLSLLW